MGSTSNSNTKEERIKIQELGNKIGNLNNYARPNLGKCFRCGQQGHLFSGWPQRRAVTFMHEEYQDLFSVDGIEVKLMLIILSPMMRMKYHVYSNAFYSWLLHIEYRIWMCKIDMKCWRHFWFLTIAMWILQHFKYGAYHNYALTLCIVPFMSLSLDNNMSKSCKFFYLLTFMWCSFFIVFSSIPVK